jgi:dolichol-phosphate mannosyltransferase
VVVPCYNEAGCFKRFSSELFPALNALKIPWEVVAVDDGSTDETGDILRNMAAQRPGLRVLTHSRNRGMGAALRTGFAGATGDWIATLDADMTFHPNQLAKLIDAQMREDADLVSGSPFLENTGAAQVSWARRLPSLIINAAYRMICGRELTAYTPIFRLYRASALRALFLRSEGFEINAEIAIGFLEAGFKVIEVPVVLTVRQEGASKLAPLRELRRHALLGVRHCISCITKRLRNNS